MLDTPARKEIQELQFKLFTQLRLFPTDRSIKLDNPTSLITTASKYGLIFAGVPSGITCLQTNSVVSIQNQRNNNRGSITSFPRRELNLGVLPYHLAVNCDNELLAAAVMFDNCSVLLIYSVTSFAAVDIKTKCEVRTSSTPGVTVIDLQWNPGVPNVIGVVLSDGSAFVYEFKDNAPTISSIPPASQASCLCWSPKGKQIVIGAKYGSLTQYKPDLKAVKTFPPPQIYNQPEVVSVQWLSNYQFIAAYKDRMDSSSKTAVIIVNVPKGANPSYVNYEDICFPFGTNRPEHHFIHQQSWNIIILGTTNGTEVVVLGQNGESWEQWMQDESNRAQLPVSEDYEDVYLTGMAIDYSPHIPVPIGENNFINPMPYLLLYSQEGDLCFYNVINLMPNSPPLCQAPQPLPDQSGMHLFTDIQSGHSERENRPLQEVQSPVSTGQVKAGDFKLTSFGTELSFNTNKEKVPTTLSSQSPFSALNTQKPNQFIMQTMGQPLDGFGIMVENSSASATLATPKFSTSTPLVPQQSTVTSTFLLPTTSAPPPVHSSPQTNSSIPPMTQHTPISRGLNPFQFSTSTSTIPIPHFPVISASETSGGTQISTKPPLLMTPILPSAITSIPSQGIPLSSSKPETEKEVKSKNSARQAHHNLAEEKEGVATELSQAANKLEEEKEPIIEVDFVGAIKEEISNFNLEMQSLDQLKNSLNFSVGNKESHNLVAKLNDLKKFDKDVKETTIAQEAEVSALVGAVVEMFSWLEIVKTKQKQISNPRFMDIMESQDLDPVTKKNLNNIEQYIYYLDTQIKQANLQIDALWAQHKGKSLKTLELPNMETIYQTIVAENYILAAQKIRVTELEVRLKEKLKTISRKIPKLTDFSTPSLKHDSDIELDALADKLLFSKLNKSGENESILKDNSDTYLNVGRSQKYLSQKKEILLHKWHKNHVMINAKSPKHQSGHIDLSKFSRTISKPSTVQCNAQNDTDRDESMSKLLLTDQKPKSIFTMSKQTQFSAQNADHLFNPEVTKSANNIPCSTQKIEKGNIIEAQQLKLALPKKETLFKNKADFELKGTLTSNTQMPFGIQSQTPFSSTFDPKTFSPNSSSVITKEAITSKNTSVNTNSDNVSSNINSTSVQPKNFETAFSFKSPQTSATPSSIAKPSENVAVKFSVTSPSIDGTISSTSNDFESKENSKKEDIKSELQKEVPLECNQMGTMFSFGSGTTLGGTATSASSSASPINFFGTSLNPSTPPPFSFNKSSVVPTNNNVTSTNASAVKTIFGTPSPAGNTSSTASTSIFGGKPITSLSPQFINLATTPQLTSTTSSSVLTTTLTTKPSTSTAVTVAATTAPFFFTKPGNTKYLFANVQVSGTNSPNSSTLFKNSVFTASQVQQDVAPASTVTVSSSNKGDSAVSSSTLSASPPAVATSTPVTTGTSITISNAVSAPSTSISFVSSPPIAVQETSLSNLVISTSAAIATSSTVTTTVSNVVTEKETTNIASPFGIPPSSLIFGAKTSAQTVPGYDSIVSNQTSAPKSFENNGTTVTATTDNSSIFGGTVPKTSIFGNQNTVPAFGNNSTSSSPVYPTTASPAFGGSVTKTTTPSIFGTPVTFGTTTTNSSIFGAAAALSSTSFFGTPTTTSAFGTSSSTPLFSPPTTTNASSFFGQPVCSTSTVTNAFNSISFCQKPPAVTTTASIFGGNRSPFDSGGGAAGTGGGMFGQTTSSPGTFGLSGGSLFGSATTFGSPQQQTNMFQPQPQANLFQAPTGGNLFSPNNTGGGSFSSGNQSVAQSGFGAPPSFQNKPFGAPGSPVFGGASTFGSAPTFGGTPTFGSPNKVFGSPTTVPGAFGTPTHSSTFENLACQNTISFGNLAQGQPGFNSNPPFAAVGTPQPSSFPTTSTFGGSSFSTWR